MDSNCESESFKKVFGHLRIEWKVENFCLAVLDEGCTIYSPEFVLRGDCLTRWKMALEIKSVRSESVPVSFILERLPGPGPCKVFADWEVIVTAGKKRFGAVESSFDFGQNYIRLTSFPSLQKILENFRPFSCDTLQIECNMIVRTGKEIKMDEPSSVGLKHLSSDLINMLYQSKFHDVTVEIAGYSFNAHKFMLSRISLFKSMLLQIPAAQGNVLCLQKISYGNVRDFIDFLYSGDMNVILNKPSLSMYDFLHNSRCDTLLRYFSPERLFMNTKIEAESSWFYWNINDFSSRTEEIFSPLYKGINPNITWQIHLNPLFSSLNRDYISIFVEVVDGLKPLNCCLEFAVLDTLSELHFPKRIINADMNVPNTGFPCFINRHDLESRSMLLHNDTIHLVFRPRIAVAKPTSSLGARFMSFVTLPPNRTSYEELSDEMASIIKDSQYDLIVQVGEENFHAHKSLLAARSTKFRRMIHNKASVNTLTVWDMRPAIFSKLLAFIYCGVLKDCEFDDLIQLYGLAPTYGVKGMQQEIVESLKGKVNDENRSRIMELTRTFNDKNLVKVSRSSNSC